MDDSLLSKAFVVENITEGFNFSVPPSTGQEYLQHVVYEASKCPQVVVANIDKRKIKNKININLEQCSQINTKNSLPSSDWQCHQVAMFSALRNKVNIVKKSGKFKPLSLPKPHSEEKWFSICFGEKNSRLEPSLTVMLSMSEPLIGRLLEYQLEWLDEGLRPNQGKWIYALLACLSLPLMPITCSVLRDLARQCAKLKCSKSFMDDKDSIILNLIICLVSRYFGQIDLAD